MLLRQASEGQEHLAEQNLTYDNLAEEALGRLADVQIADVSPADAVRGRNVLPQDVHPVLVCAQRHDDFEKVGEARAVGRVRPDV